MMVLVYYEICSSHVLNFSTGEVVWVLVLLDSVQSMNYWWGLDGFLSCIQVNAAPHRCCVYRSDLMNRMCCKKAIPSGSLWSVEHPLCSLDSSESQAVLLRSEPYLSGLCRLSSDLSFFLFGESNWCASFVSTNERDKRVKIGMQQCSSVF